MNSQLQLRDGAWALRVAEPQTKRSLRWPLQRAGPLAGTPGTEALTAVPTLPQYLRAGQPVSGNTAGGETLCL